MVRYCVVENCNESDISGLAHRFPKKMDSRIKWQEALNLLEWDLDLLFNKYVVCKNHFKPTDYRNSISTHLNTTAIPHQPDNTLKTHKQITFKPSRSTVENVEISEDKTNASISEQIVEPPEIPAPTIESIEYETVFAQRRRKRTCEEIEKEIKKLTKVAFKKVEPKQEPSVISEMNVVFHNPEKYYIEKDDVSSKDVTTTVVNLDSCEFPNIIEVVLVEAGCQTDEFEEKDESEFGSLSRVELVKLLKEKDQTIESLQKKIGKFETAMSAFKVLMNPLD